jgi:hypothetical protein
MAHHTPSFLSLSQIYLLSTMKNASRYSPAADGRASQRAANKANEQIGKVAANMPSMPTWSTAKGDWRVWIGVLLAISFVSAAIGAMGNVDTVPSTPVGSPDSYLI